MKRLIIIFTILLGGLSTPLLATRHAHIKTDKTVVYADQNLSVPLGYLNRGKRVLVGEVSRKYGTLLPIQIAGRIGWIQIRDVQFIEVLDGEGENALEHEVLALDPGDRFTENNHIGLIYNVFVFGKQWEELSYMIGDEVGERPFYLSLYFDHRPPDLRYSFGVGLGYLYLKQENLVLSAPLVEFKGQWSAIKYKYFNFDLFAGIYFSGAFKVDSAYNPTDEEYDNTGELYGLNYGVEIKYLPYGTFSFINGLAFNRGIISGLAPIKISNEEGDTIPLDRFEGVNYYFGINYKF